MSSQSDYVSLTTIVRLGRYYIYPPIIYDEIVVAKVLLFITLILVLLMIFKYMIIRINIYYNIF